MRFMDRTTELTRLLENLLRYGVVASVDHAAQRCTVKTGQLLTAPLKWITLRAGSARTRWAPSPGEQVLLLNPGGDTTRGCVLPALFSDGAPAPDAGSDANVTVYADGATIAYDPQTHTLAATLPAGGAAQVTAPAGVVIRGDVRIEGKLHVSADVTADTTITTATDVVAAGVSLTKHPHDQVMRGGDRSGLPVAS